MYLNINAFTYELARDRKYRIAVGMHNRCIVRTSKFLHEQNFKVFVWYLLWCYYVHIMTHSSGEYMPIWGFFLEVSLTDSIELSP